MTTALATGLACAAWSGGAAAQEGRQTGRGAEEAGGGVDAAHALEARRLSGDRVVVDGRLDEAAWAGGAVATGFTQTSPDPGAAATERTEVRILYDDDALYIGARLYDAAPDSIVGRLARRDHMVHSDWFVAALDSYHDRRTGFAFGLNPAGVKFDGFLYADTETDVDWDAVWEGAATIDAEGWVAELRIPLSQLRYDAASGAETWGLNFKRQIGRRNEQAFWAPVEPNARRMVSVFGELRGLERLASPRRLELQPYSVARVAREPGDAADPFHEATAWSGAMGADLKYGLTSNLTLTATINPDFGQVEADPSVVNLTANETFFPEKRPFFIEGADIFRFGIGLGDGGSLANEQLFYSRRVGRAPQGAVPDDAAWGEAPGATTILGAAKLTGKTSDGWSVGLLNAVTGRERARWVGTAGVEGDVPVEPLTSYSVARVMRDFRAGASSVGAILTATHRGIESERLAFLPDAAYAGGLNGRHRFGGDLELSGFLLGSHVRGEPEAIERLQRAPNHYFQRPGAGHLSLDAARTSMSGATAQLMLQTVGAGSWGWMTGIHAITPGFEVNDAGFQTQGDLVMHAGGLNYGNFEAGRLTRRWRLGGSAWHAYTFGGERLATGGNINGNTQFHDFSGAWAGIGWEDTGIEPRELRGGPALAGDGVVSGWGGFETDNRRDLQLSLSADFGRSTAHDGGRLALSPMLRWRPSSSADVELRPRVSWYREPAQYVATPDGAGADRWLFGRLEQRTVSLTTRVGYTVSPTLSFQLYAQPFLSAGAYAAFRTAAEPGAARFEARFADVDDVALDAAGETYAADLDGDGRLEATFDNPDFNVKELRSTAVLRWEYRPGSTLFLVWSQGRSASDRNGSLDLDRDLGRLFGAEAGYDVPTSNVLMLKLSYWLGV